jgi:hypothetical protein
MPNYDVNVEVSGEMLCLFTGDDHIEASNLENAKEVAKKWAYDQFRDISFEELEIRITAIEEQE